MSSDHHSHLPHGGGNHLHRGESMRRLRLALAINAVFLVVEVAGGFAANSLALLADAGHMLTDVAALAMAIVAARLAGSEPTAKRTFGLLRAEVIGAFLNGATLVVVVGMVFVQAWRRLGEGPEINGPLMLAVAVAGLIANVVSAAVLFEHRHENINLRGAYLHMAADALGSVGAIVAGAVVWTTGGTPIDPIVSVLIGLLILRGGWDLVKESMGILLEGTPAHISYDEVLAAISAAPHIKDVHDLHIWNITSGIPALSVHVRIYPECSDTTHWQVCLGEVQDMLRERFGITHSTIQVEPQDYDFDGRVI